MYAHYQKLNGGKKWRTCLKFWNLLKAAPAINPRRISPQHGAVINSTVLYNLSTFSVFISNINPSWLTEETELNSFLSHLIEQLWVSWLIHFLLNITNGVLFPLNLHWHLYIRLDMRRTPLPMPLFWAPLHLFLSHYTLLRDHFNRKKKKKRILHNNFPQLPLVNFFSKCDSYGLPNSLANWKLISRIFLKCQFLFKEISCLWMRITFHSNRQ